MSTTTAGLYSGRQEVLHAGRVVLGIAVGLTALGLVVTFSSSSGRLAYEGRDLTTVLTKQLCWAALGALTCFLASRTSLEMLSKAARPLLTATVVLLLATLFLAPERNNSRRWLYVLGISVQASELLKVAVLLYLATALAAREESEEFGHKTPIFGILAPVGIGAVLVLLEPDLGASLFVVAEAIVILGLAGVRPTRLVPFALTAAPLLAIYGYTRFAHVRRRLAGWGSEDGSGSQVHESLLAIGSGGLFGYGLGAGTHKLGKLPEPNTDFIFAVIGEEMGFVGCAGVIVAFMALVWYGRTVAWGARILGPQAYYLAAGATFVLGFQAVINIAVVTGMAPTKGLALPFISAGGSNLVVAMAAVGLIVNVSRRAAAASGDVPWA